MQRIMPWIGICGPDIAEAYEITKSPVRTIWPFYSCSVCCYGNRSFSFPSPKKKLVFAREQIE